MPRKATAKASPKTAPVIETMAEKLIRLRLLQKKAQRVKAVYSEIDQLEWEIATAAKRPETIISGGKVWQIEVTDNFAVKNVVFKATGVKRWSVKFTERSVK